METDDDRNSVTDSFERLVTSSYHDDLEDPTYHFRGSEENIFDYLMFVGPTESVVSKGKLTVDTSMGYCLVVLTLFIQGLLLYAVYNRVVVGAVEWQNGILTAHHGKNWNLLAPEDLTKCDMGDSLCVMRNNTFECAPASVRLTGKWAELDTDGDGVWTREEVTAAKDELQCKYVANPIEVFDVIVNFIRLRSKDIWVHPLVQEGKAIPKTYFNYAMGDIIMCGYRNEAMCRNILNQGFFDAALKYNTVPRIGNTIQSALDYCFNLLREGGICDRSLPSTYSVWKVQSDEECGEKTFEKFVYEHPKTGASKSLLKVDYGARVQAEDVKQPQFILFKTLIILVWVMSMVNELKRLLEIFTWLLRFPGTEHCRERDIPLVHDQKPELSHQERTEAVLQELEKEEAEAAAKKEEDGKEPENRYKINGIRLTHRLLMAVVTLLRLIMLFVLSIVGVNLLLLSPEYMSLLFDAISLVFILDLATLIAMFVLRQDIREQSADVEPMEVPMYGPLWLTRRQSLTQILWFAFTIGVAIAIMYWWMVYNEGPLEQALECTCLGTGKDCVEAQKFNYDFWYRYWKEITPQVFEHVDAMREELQASEGVNASTTALAETVASTTALAETVASTTALAETVNMFAHSRPAVGPAYADSGKAASYGAAWPRGGMSKRRRPWHRMLNARRHRQVLDF